MGNLTVLKLLRQASGMTLDHVDKTGVSKWTYTLVEAGTYKTSANIRVKISKLYGLKSKRLFDSKGYAKKISMKEAKIFVKHKSKGEPNEVVDKSKPVKRRVRKPVKRSGGTIRSSPTKRRPS